MDEKDYNILQMLKKNAKLTNKEIARKLMVPLTTVHNRIKKLEKSGSIKNYTVVLDDKKLGSISAYVLLTVDYNMLKEKKLSQYQLASKIRNHGCVEQASMVTGEHDILLKIRAKNMDELDNFVTKYLRNVEGVRRTETMIILNET